MQADQPAVRLTAKNIYLKKVEEIFGSGRPAEAANFALDVIGIVDPDDGLDIAKFLSGQGYNYEALVILKEICSKAPLRLDMREHFGRRLVGAFTKTGAPIEEPTVRTPASECEFVTVLGSSYARSFASGTRFFPLMLAGGGFISFLTPETTTNTRRITFNALRRTDPRSLVLMNYGNGDADMHRRNMYGTLVAVHKGELPSQEAVMRTAATRYCDMIDEIRAQMNLNIVVFAALPMLDDVNNWLVVMFNDELRKRCAASGTPLLDLTNELTDPATGMLKKEYASSDTDPHLAHTAIPLIEDGLKKLNILPAAGEAFQWEYMFRFSIDPLVETRIWSEPHMGGKNITYSKKIQFAQILERVGHIIVGHVAHDAPGRILIVNGREGFLSFEIPPKLVTSITSVDTNSGKALMGNRIRRLLGRTDVQFVTVERLTDASTDDYDYVVLVMHEDDDTDQCLEVLATAMTKVRRLALVLTARDIATRLNAMPQEEPVREISLSNRLIVGYWSHARLYALRPAQ